MVFGVITLAATVPLLATSTVLLQNTAQDTQDKNGVEGDIKTEKCHMVARASSRMSQKRQQELQDHVLVLKNDALYLDHKKYADHHPFSGYFLPYPGTEYDGLVSTINKENMLNWIYVDRKTYQVKYGVRAVAELELTGPMSLLPLKQNELRLGFAGWEGFVAVEEDPGEWAIYFDKDDDGLKSKAGGKPVVEIELVRMNMEDYQPTETRGSKDEPD